MSGEKKFLETVKSIGIALIVALSIRAFVIEPFKIPSGSMIPTLLIGDQIFVNKFIYGVRFPFSKKRIWEGRDPKSGEVIVFMYPVDESLDYIKRVVGVPGDLVQVDGDQITINGKLVDKKPLSFKSDPDHGDRVYVQPSVPYKKMTLYLSWNEFSIFHETLGENPHLVQYDRSYSLPKEFRVPDDAFFVMGDNRDNSQDSRKWGFVPKANIKGRAMFIWLSLDWEEWKWNWRYLKKLAFWPELGRWTYQSLYDVVRWHRFGRWLY